MEKCHSTAVIPAPCPCSGGAVPAPAPAISNMHDLIVLIDNKIKQQTASLIEWAEIQTAGNKVIPKAYLGTGGQFGQITFRIMNDEAQHARDLADLRGYLQQAIDYRGEGAVPAPAPKPNWKINWLENHRREIEGMAFESIGFLRVNLGRPKANTIVKSWLKDLTEYIDNPAWETSEVKYSFDLDGLRKLPDFKDAEGMAKAPPAPAPASDQSGLDEGVSNGLRDQYVGFFKSAWNLTDETQFEIKPYNRGVVFYLPYGTLDVKFDFRSKNPPAPSPFMNLVLQSLIQGAAGYVASKIPAPAPFDRCSGGKE